MAGAGAGTCRTCIQVISDRSAFMRTNDAARVVITATERARRYHDMHVAKPQSSGVSHGAYCAARPATP